MKISIPELQSMIAMYHETLNIQTPMRDELKIHFIKHREGILNNLVQIGGAWTLMLSCIKAESDTETANIEEARRLADEFRKWADAELDKLHKL